MPPAQRYCWIASSYEINETKDIRGNRSALRNSRRTALNMATQIVDFLARKYGTAIHSESGGAYASEKKNPEREREQKS